MNAAVPPRMLLTDDQKAAQIRIVVTEAGQRLRERYPLLKHQNAIGAAILVLSLAGMIGCASLYALGHLSAWACIPLVAIFASFTHELEHDLIHWMYFRKRPALHHLMMALVWLARPSTVNPWIRRHLHFAHHKFSGSERDLEERGITNGDRWGLRRLIMVGDNVQSVLLRLTRAPRGRRLKLLARAAAAYFPLGWLHWGTWYAFLGFHAANGVAHLLGHAIVWPVGVLSVMPAINFFTVVLVAPNVLRTFCLHFVSSNMHYYGDVEPDNVIQQTQVLNPAWMLPLQLFCFNFGATHAIHHFVVKEPFYIRQMTAPAAHRVMRQMGVRFNDTGTFRRANRWNRAAA